MQYCVIVSFIHLFLKVFRLLSWNYSVLFIIQLLLLYHKVMWCQDKKSPVRLERTFLIIWNNTLYVWEKCSEMLDYMPHIFYTWNEPQKHKYAIFNQNNSTPVWLKNIQTYECTDAAHRPSGKTIKTTKSAQCHRAFTEMTKKPLSAIQCLAFLEVRLGCNIKNLKCVARLHFSFRRDIIFFESSQLRQPKSDSPPAESSFSLCNTTLVYINSHRLYELPLWQEPYVGTRVCVCVCVCVCVQEACLWACINEQFACLYSNHAVVYIQFIQGKCVLLWVLLHEVSLHVFIRLRW